MTYTFGNWEWQTLCCCILRILCRHQPESLPLMMMMASSMRRKSKREYSIDDIPIEVMLMIFKRCEPLACYRARLVCRRWRMAIDRMDKENRETILGEGQARLFICDRRRAILEKFNTLPSCSKSVKELTQSRKSTFHSDCYAHTVFNDWAYRFDLSDWTRNFDITEVWLQNFGSYLERDHVRLYIDTTTPSEVFNHLENASAENKAISNASSSASRASSNSSQLYQSGGSSSGSFSFVASIPYNLLPSSQKKARAMPDSASKVILNEAVCAELTKLSDGCFERLVEQLRHIHPLHLVFNDHSYYEKRPTLLLFWFLKKLPKLRRLTLDCIQGDQMVELHKVFNIDGIDELNIIQPKTNPCIIANGGLLDAFLQVKAANRRRFRLCVTGKNDINASAICNFIRKWRDHRDIIPFQTILIDERSVHPSEFIHATKCSGCNDCGGEVVRHKFSDKTGSTKQLIFRHRKHNVWINYKFEDKYLVFTYYDPKDSNHFMVKTAEPERTVVSFYSSTAKVAEKPEESDIAIRPSTQMLLMDSNNNSHHHHHSNNMSGKQNFLERIFSHLRSNA
ncbi:unnamed protein product [Thelazia callipaeda]|uniref:F-box domain-containing protein n=1 Tax=Thelazia callipaeda TaxID=103827 RepID=A0A0N5CUK9_THECL|nr:unnamed protein product [Thelazia callipaeda]